MKKQSKRVFVTKGNMQAMKATETVCRKIVQRAEKVDMLLAQASKLILKAALLLESESKVAKMLAEPLEAEYTDTIGEFAELAEFNSAELKTLADAVSEAENAVYGMRLQADDKQQTVLEAIEASTVPNCMK